MTFDNIEYISIKKQTSEFPQHFHETFCFSLVYQGINQINFKHQTVFSEAGCISIVNPYEIHSNPLINQNTYTKFDTIYVPKEVVKYILNGKRIKFIDRSIKNEKAKQLFLKLKSVLEQKDHEGIERYLSQFINTLKFCSEEKEQAYLGLNFDSLNQINEYIELHIYDKLNLNDLSKLAHINKFGFSKKFKMTTGMTPMNYILMRKVFSSKTAIDIHTELTDIAYQYNFTDMAHFSKTFKRFVGISPKAYQESLPKKIQ